MNMNQFGLSLPDRELRQKGDDLAIRHAEPVESSVSYAIKLDGNDAEIPISLKRLSRNVRLLAGATPVVRLLPQSAKLSLGQNAGDIPQLRG